LAHLAEQGRADVFHLPRPMTQHRTLDFSFSGLKTQVLTTWQTAIRHTPSQHLEQARADIARAFEEAVIETLAIKCRWALQQTGLSRLVIAGGVGANRRLRERLTKLAEEMTVAIYYPRPIFCTDNGAMIAYAGYRRLAAGQQEPLEFRAHPRWAIDQL